MCCNKGWIPLVSCCFTLRNLFHSRNHMTSSTHNQLSSAASCSSALLTHKVCPQFVVTEDSTNSLWFMAPTVSCWRAWDTNECIRQKSSPPPFPLPPERGWDDYQNDLPVELPQWCKHSWLTAGCVPTLSCSRGHAIHTRMFGSQFWGRASFSGTATPLVCLPSVYLTSSHMMKFSRDFPSVFASNQNILLVSSVKASVFIPECL